MAEYRSRNRATRQEERLGDSLARPEWAVSATRRFGWNERLGEVRQWLVSTALRQRKLGDSATWREGTREVDSAGQASLASRQGSARTSLSATRRLGDSDRVSSSAAQRLGDWDRTSFSALLRPAACGGQRLRAGARTRRPAGVDAERVRIWTVEAGWAMAHRLGVDTNLHSLGDYTR